MGKRERKPEGETKSRHTWVDLSAELLGPEDDGRALKRAIELLRWADAVGFSHLGVRCTLDAEGKVPSEQLTFYKKIEEAGTLLAEGPALFLSSLIPVEYIKEDLVGRLRGFSWGPGRLLFVHLPPDKDLKMLARKIRILSFGGITPVVLAPERNPEVERLPELARYLLQSGAQLSLDAGCLLGEEGAGAGRTARRLLELGFISLISGYLRGDMRPIDPMRVWEVVEDTPRAPWWRSHQASGSIFSRARRLVPSGN